MCGIYCSLSRSGPILPDAILTQRLRARGPDSLRTETRTITSDHDRHSDPQDVHLCLCSSVLSLRGPATVIQPLVDPTGEFSLCWNGEAWRIGDECTSGNDTEAVHALLVEALSPASHSAAKSDGLTRVASALSTVSGPYAFVFVDVAHGRVYFGRDFLGRRSLLWRTTDAGDLVICSVGDGMARGQWQEVDADGVYCLELRDRDRDPVIGADGTATRQMGSFSAHLVPYAFASDKTTVGPVSVLPDLSVSRPEASCENAHDALCLSPESPSVNKLDALLRDSLSLRVLHIPHPPMIDYDIRHKSCRLAILFSGGLDCTVLARISHELLPATEPIDLLNVAFENPRVHKTGGALEAATRATFESCPDRITGRASHAELQQVCPSREWRFVAINVPYAETLQHRPRILALMHPHDTEMDLSIASALYFASRGAGLVAASSPSPDEPYTTPARVLLSGLGADELFAGYSRHAAAFRLRGRVGLSDELRLDVARLGRRNLGRDDRVLSHWGREVRFPYLDERLVAWAVAAPLADKCGFGEGDGSGLAGESGLAAALEPGKKVLRCLARKLGMEKVAKEKKRAIQFGARTAKMETGKTKGTTLVS